MTLCQHEFREIVHEFPCQVLVLIDSYTADADIYCIIFFGVLLRLYLLAVYLVLGIVASLLCGHHVTSEFYTFITAFCIEHL